MLNPEIAIDFGTSSLRIYVDGKGVTINEPNMLAVDMRDEAVLASGRDAKMLIDRSSAVIDVTAPFLRGRIQNYPMAEYLVGKFIKKIASGRILLPSAYVSMPSNLSEVDRRAICDTIEEAGIRKIYFAEENACALIGAEKDIFTELPEMVINFGASKTSCAVYKEGVCIAENNLKLGSHDMDEAIIRMIKVKYGLSIGHLSAEELKESIGSALTDEEECFFDVKGMNIKTCLPEKKNISSDDIGTVISGILSQIAELVTSVMTMLSRDELESIGTRGVTAVGGGAKLNNFGGFIKLKTGLDAYIPARPEFAAVNGAAMLFDMKNKYNRRLMIKYTN